MFNDLHRTIDAYKELALNFQYYFKLRIFDLKYLLWKKVTQILPPRLIKHVAP